MKWFIFGLFLGLLVACTPSESGIQTAIAETAAAQPTEVVMLLPTETDEPTATIDPFELTKAANQTQNAAHQGTLEANATNIALTPPTHTPRPTFTPRPTNTFTPAPTATPIIFTGTGDAIVDVDIPDTFIGLVHITGNASGGYFGVSSIDENNEQISLLVNTTDPYDGIRPLDFKDGENTVRFEVTASGAWTIEVFPFLSARVLTVPGVIEGVGDDVILLVGSDPDTALINGNPDGDYFGVFGYGDGIDLLVNTTDPYVGTVLIAPETFILEIQAVGAWMIEITS